MPHIHATPGHYDHTVSAFIVRRDGEELKILLHMHRKHGKLLPPGGHIELNETPWAALAHELEEESGYRFAELSVLQPPDAIDLSLYRDIAVQPLPIHVNAHYITADHLHTDMAYAMHAEDKPRQSPAQGESQDIRWLSLDELEQLDDDEIFYNTKQTALAVLTRFASEWKAVPATAYPLTPPPFSSLRQY